MGLSSMGTPNARSSSTPSVVAAAAWESADWSSRSDLKKYVADALVEVNPDGLIFDGDAEGEVEFDAVRGGRGSLGICRLVEQVVGHRCVWFYRLLAPCLPAERGYSRLQVCSSIMLDAAGLCLDREDLFLQSLIFRHSKVSHNQ